MLDEHPPPLLIARYGLEAVLHTEAEVTTPEVNTTKQVEAWAIVQRNSQGEVDGKAILKTYNTLNTKAEIAFIDVCVSTSTIIEMHTIGENRCLPLINSINSQTTTIE